MEYPNAGPENSQNREIKWWKWILGLIVAALVGQFALVYLWPPIQGFIDEKLNLAGQTVPAADPNQAVTGLETGESLRTMPEPAVNKAGTPTSVPRIVSLVPYRYDTQFTTGRMEDGYLRPVSDVANLFYDDLKDYCWLLYWSNYRPENGDTEPEFTFYFDNATVTGFRVRNGNLSSRAAYYNNARMAQFYLDITYDGGKVRTEMFTLEDEYTLSYQEFGFLQQNEYENVTKIELRIKDRYVGSGESTRYYVYLTNLMFYGYE